MLLMSRLSIISITNSSKPYGHRTAPQTTKRLGKPLQYKYVHSKRPGDRWSKAHVFVRTALPLGHQGSEPWLQLEFESDWELPKMGFSFQGLRGMSPEHGHLNSMSPPREMGTEVPTYVVRPPPRTSNSPSGNLLSP